MNPTQKTLHVCANFAITSDGKINRTAGLSSVFTSSIDLESLLYIRKYTHAILVGRKTLEADQMTLTVPNLPLEKQPARIIASASGQFDFSHKIFSTPGGRIYLLSNRSIKSTSLPPNTENFIGTIDQFLTKAPEFGLRYIHCEGGSDIFHHLLTNQWIDLLHLTVNPQVVFGNQEALTIIGKNLLNHSIKLELLDSEINAANEFFLKYRPLYEINGKNTLTKDTP